MKAATKITETSEYLQVSESCALAWAHSLGVCYSRKRKGYYVDGHDRPDVLAHCAIWLAKEACLEKRQYLWIQMPLAQAIEQCAHQENSSDFHVLLSTRTQAM